MDPTTNTSQGSTPNSKDDLCTGSSPSLAITELRASQNKGKIQQNRGKNLGNLTLPTPLEKEKSSSLEEDCGSKSSVRRSFARETPKSKNKRDKWTREPQRRHLYQRNGAGITRLNRKGFRFSKNRSMILQSSTPEARSPSDPGQSLGKRQGEDKPRQDSSQAGKKAGKEAAKRSAGKGGGLRRREEPKKRNGATEGARSVP